MSCSEPTKHWDSFDLDFAKNVNAAACGTSSIFFRRIVGPMFMRVNSKCAHQVRRPLAVSATCREELPAARR
jgi:hypothetical protein